MLRLTPQVSYSSELVSQMDNDSLNTILGKLSNAAWSLLSVNLNKLNNDEDNLGDDIYIDVMGLDPNKEIYTVFALNLLSLRGYIASSEDPDVYDLAEEFKERIEVLIPFDGSSSIVINDVDESSAVIEIEKVMKVFVDLLGNSAEDFEDKCKVLLNRIKNNDMDDESNEDCVQTMVDILKEMQ